MLRPAVPSSGFAALAEAFRSSQMVRHLLGKSHKPGAVRGPGEEVSVVKNEKA